jgi:nucleoid DNA-binding protein
MGDKPMAENKTRQSDKSVKAFIDAVADENKRKDCRAIIKMMHEIIHKIPKMWGDNIVGFGSYHYKHDSGREGDYFITGVSPRKPNVTVYIMPVFQLPAAYENN